jgi:hypothetical protein
MTCSAQPDRALMNAAAALCGRATGTQAVKALVPLTGGGNNRLYRVETADGFFALKSYGPLDVRGDRLEREFGGLDFLTSVGTAGIPAALAADRERRLALYSWIDGEPAGAGAVESEDAGASDVGQALALVAGLRAASRDHGDRWRGEAAEACLSAQILTAQVDARLDRLRSVSGEPALAAFLAERLEPAAAAAVAGLRALYSAAGLDPAADLAPSLRVLSPSDFGFHNALRGADGRLTFIDFEYFGWDDPVKLTADFLWHPGMRLTPAMRAVWRDGAQKLFGADDPAFPVRLSAQTPLFALRWCLIILNEFLPDRWERRVFAGQADPAGWSEAKAEQLAKAEALLRRAFDPAAEV